jgi:mono/diheme cytochrome c family protein
MKSVCLIVIVALLTVVPLSSWAQDNGAALYKSKCAMCHGEKGEGKTTPMKSPALKGTQMTVEKMVEYLTKGEKGKGFHENPINDFNADKAKVVAEFIIGLK